MVLNIYGVFTNLIMGIFLCICLSVVRVTSKQWTPHFNYEVNLPIKHT